MNNDAAILNPSTRKSPYMDKVGNAVYDGHILLTTFPSGMSQVEYVGYEEDLISDDHDGWGISNFHCGHCPLHSGCAIESEVIGHYTDEHDEVYLSTVDKDYISTLP